MQRAVLLLVVLAVQAVAAQEGPTYLRPNYRTIAKVTADSHGEYYIDTLEARFVRCDTTLTTDALRCIYYGSGTFTLREAQHHYMMLQERLGRINPAVTDAWWQYQMLMVAVWSSGDGSKRHPLHVRSSDEAALVAADMGSPLWFKVKGRCRFSVTPQQ